MDATMTPAEVSAARRVIGLSGTSSRARRNGLNRVLTTELAAMVALERKGHVEFRDGQRRLTGQGVQQLKLQIGEFAMPRGK